ncbi:hypothetical protein H4R18_002530 [Coemansia javaensis]|uniref:CBM21 domain-containing protein n=1 Tax=Coemansia javaensis TaxID=2761396 RepID=A0A9W8HEU0_9FUNG|nr:hypothetical protein H4R18_002530 [Coemansia javaensis]
MYIPASSAVPPMQSQRLSADMLAAEQGCQPPARHPSLPPLGLRTAGAKQRPAPPPPAYTPPAVVRKGSGEVVRSCLRCRGAASRAGSRAASPAPVRMPRFVHFGADLERVRWFLKGQSPQAACRDADADSCGASEDEQPQPQPPQPQPRRSETVRLSAVRRPAPSFAAFEEAPVVVEHVALADARRGSVSVRGSIKVHNIAFEKEVAVRYSLDQWRTAHEAPATYSRMLAPGQSGRPSVDRFEFTLALPSGGGGGDDNAAAQPLPVALALCARYRVAGAEHWDNNGGSNYLFKISLPAAPAIVDDDCDRDAALVSAAAAAAAAADGLRAPRRLTFGSREAAAPAHLHQQQQHQQQRFAAPTAADTRRYMAQSAALFGARQSPSPSPSPSPPPPQQQQQPDLPLFQDMAWCGSIFADSLSMSMAPPPHYQAGASLAASMAAAPPRPPSPMRLGGSPLRRSVFDADGAAVRTGSPLAWSHNTGITALQC